MQPLREKLNSSFHKLGDKLKRVRSSEAIDAAADSKAKQPRTVRNPTSYSHLVLNPALQQKTLPPLHPADSPTATLTSGSQSVTPSLKSISPDPKPTGSAGNPIDLTSSPLNSSIIDLAYSSTPSMSSATTATFDGENAGGLLHFQDPMDQVREDSKLAWALQCELNRESEQLSPTLAPDDTVFDVDLHHYLIGLTQKKCSKCRTKVSIFGEHNTARIKSMLIDEGVLHPYVQCKKCKGWICMGCAAYSDRQIPPYVHSRSGDGFKVVWCCAHSRLFLIWSTACGPDYKRLLPKPQGSMSSASGSSLRYRLRSHSRNPKSDSPITQEKGILGAPNTAPAEDTNKVTPGSTAAVKATGRLDSLLPKGTGYGGHGDSVGWYQKKAKGSATTSKPPPTSHKKDQDKQMQNYLCVYFQAMNLLLPSWTGIKSTSFDFSNEVSGLVSSMLSRSPLLPKVSEVLRNDSVDELAEQTALYNSILDFIERMGDHPSTFPLLYRDLCLYRHEDQLVHISFEPNRLVGEISAGFERSQAILSILGNLASHCQHFVQASAAHLGEFETEEEQQALVLARRIVQAHDVLDTNRRAIASEEAPARGTAQPRLSGDDEGTQMLTEETDQKGNIDGAHQPLDQWHRLHSVEEVSDERMLETHSYAKSATQMSSEGQKLGRMKKLVTQVSGLRTSLPDGIYVRHCSSRLDVMKVLITGPEGTPYENGLFEFDLFCPATFPNQPPRMQFRTTGAGTVRFNPNLYQCGKVCLSLLGTWSGQKWTEQSTILQILVSIQAMIFNDKPWYNEPGRERTPDEAASQRYNSQVQGWTLQHAILYWIEKRLSQPKSINGIVAGGRPPASKPVSGNKSGMSSAAAKKPQVGPLAAVPNVHYTFGTIQDPGGMTITGIKTGSWFGKNTQPSSAKSSVPSNGEQPPTDGAYKPKFSFSNLLASGTLTTDTAALKPGVGPPLFTPVPAAGGAAPNFPPTALPGSYTAELSLAELGDDFFTPAMEEDGWDEFEEMQFEQMHQLDQPNRAVPDMRARTEGEDDYIWGDVIRMHFKAKAKKILETAAEWRTTGKGKRPEDPIVRQLQEAMAKHGFLSDS